MACSHMTAIWYDYNMDYRDAGTKWDGEKSNGIGRGQEKLCADGCNLFMCDSVQQLPSFWAKQTAVNMGQCGLNDFVTAFIFIGIISTFLVVFLSIY